MISDKTRIQLSGLLVVLKVAKAVRPVVSKLVSAPLSALLDDIESFTDIVRISLRFNSVFASRGWVASGVINVPAAARAMELAKAQRWDEADEVLADAFSADIVRVHLRGLSKLRCFAPRTELAMLAVDDYEAGRFHACVPVALALLDGMGKDLLGAGLFRATAQLRPRESFLEVGGGIAEALRLMSRTRPTTTIAPIDVPYRHGIMHGTDLGYANRVTAAKTWALVLAFGQYANEFVEPPKAPEPPLREVLRNYAKNKEELDIMEAEAAAWRPTPDHERRQQLDSQTFPEDSAASFVHGLIVAWQRSKWGVIAAGSHERAKRGDKLPFFSAKLKANLASGPEAFRILNVEENWCAAWVTVQLVMAPDVEEEVRLRLLRVSGEAEWPPRPGSRSWQIVSLWPLESVRRVAYVRGEGD